MTSADLRSTTRFSRDVRSEASSGVSPDEAPAQGEPRRPRLLELGVGLVVVGAPFAFLPMSAAPFVDVKIVVLLVGCLLIWAGGARVDPTLAVLAWVWVGAMTLSGLFGVDRWLSVMGPDNLASGLILFGPCAYLGVAGASLPSSLVDRIPSWLFATAVAVSLVAIAYRFAPGTLSIVIPDLAFSGSTLGHAVLLSGVTAAALSAAVGARASRSVWFVPALIVIASALSVSTKRAGLVAVAVGLLIALVRTRPGRMRSLLISGVVAGTLVAWAVATPLVPTDEPLSGIERFEQFDTDSARARVLITGTLVRTWSDRPLLGWGPGNTWSGYLANATPRDVELAKRGVADAHNVVLGSAVTTGAVGLAALLALMAVVARRTLRSSRRLGWAAGAAAALLVVHLLQPVSAPLTPLMFLLAGIAAGPSRSRRETVGLTARAGRALAGGLLAVGLVLSVLVLTSSVLEQWGRSHNSTWALRAAVTLAPGRISPVYTLAVYRGQDAAGGDAAAGREARELVESVVRRHPLDPGVRWIGIDTGLVMGDTAYARSWLQRQIDVFPSDLASLSPAALDFLRTGVRPGPAAFLQSVGSGADTSNG